MKKTHPSTRYLAITILCHWEERVLPLDQVMEQQTGGLVFADQRDRQFLFSLVYGIMRWRTYLDWVVEKYSKHPLSKIKSRTLQALRLGIFQLLLTDRIPASAAINETVQALKDMRQPKWLTGYVNGLLRTVDRERATIPDPRSMAARTALPEAALLNHPQWLLERWKKRYGAEQTISICRHNNIQAPISLRVNTSRTTVSALLAMLRNQGLHAEIGAYSPLALKLEDYHGPITTIPGFDAGLFQVQDEAAQLVSYLLGPLVPGKSYLDGCAGLGGKTSHLAQMLPAGAMLSAVEPNPGRMKRLRENLARLQLGTSVTIVEGTLDALLPKNGSKFTGVLVDAPCSGLGVIRRHPEIRWNRSPADLLRYQEIQSGLLDNAAELVVPGGVLVYATCSTEPEENDTVVKNFLDRCRNFTRHECRMVLPESAAGLVDGRGFFRTLPGRDDLDGFFAARLIKMKD